MCITSICPQITLLSQSLDMATPSRRDDAKCMPFRESGHANHQVVLTKEASWVRWCMPVAPELRRWRQEDHDEVHRHACRQAEHPFT